MSPVSARWLCSSRVSTTTRPSPSTASWLVITVPSSSATNPVPRGRPARSQIAHQRGLRSTARHSRDRPPCPNPGAPPHRFDDGRAKLISENRPSGERAPTRALDSPRAPGRWSEPRAGAAAKGVVRRRRRGSSPCPGAPRPAPRTVPSGPKTATGAASFSCFSPEVNSPAGMRSCAPLPMRRACSSSTSQRGNAAAAASPSGSSEIAPRRRSPAGAVRACARPSRRYGPTRVRRSAVRCPPVPSAGAQVAGQRPYIGPGGADHRDQQVGDAGAVLGLRLAHVVHGERRRR